MVYLKEITRDNYLECLKLKVRDDQRNFVASTAFSLAQSKFESQCIPVAIYNDGVMVGFLMYALDPDDNNYWIWRLMIDEKYQRKGYALEAMNKIISRITSDKSRNKILISFKESNTAAEALYKKVGFHHTGDIIDNEIVMQLDY